MQPASWWLGALVLALAAPATSAARDRADAGGDPLNKVMELLDRLKVKVVADGEAEEKAYKEYNEWCDDTANEKQNEIKTATAQKGKLQATIEKANSDIAVCDAKIEQLALAISSGEADLKQATAVREREHAEFLTAEAELADTADTLGRAINVIQAKAESKPELALAQASVANFPDLVAGLGAVVDAAGIAQGDKKKLVALVQAQEAADESNVAEEDAEARAFHLSAPAPSTYEGHGGGILEALEGLKDKADAELSDARGAEVAAQHNFDMTKDALEGQKAFDVKNMEGQKVDRSAAQESLATAKGALSVTEKELADSSTSLADVQKACIQVAADHEATVRGRSEELTMLAQAEKALGEAPAFIQTSGKAPMLLQLASASQLRTASSAKMASKAMAKSRSAVRSELLLLLQRLAKKHRSHALAQLASKAAVVMQYGESSGDDPFVKVRGLIEQLIDRLLKEAAAEATEKAYCDDQFAKTNEKKEELEDDLSTLGAKIDKAVAASVALKQDVKELQAELAALAQSQVEMDKLRQEQNAEFVQTKADLEQALSAVRNGLGILRSYYGSADDEELLQASSEGSFMQQPEPPEKHEKSEGAGGTIIQFLEVIESDAATSLAEATQQESDEASLYEKQTQENTVTKTLKDQDVKYKTQEFIGLDRAVGDMSSDRDGMSAEYSAVLEYLAKLRQRCIAKPESYEKRKARREAEIAGLKDALGVLDGETALVQKPGHRSLRQSA